MRKNIFLSRLCYCWRELLRSITLLAWKKLRTQGLLFCQSLGVENRPLYVFSLFPPLQHIFESGHTIPLLTFSFDKIFPGTNDSISVYIFLTRSFGDIHFFGIGAIDKNSHCLCLTKPFIEASSHNTKINIILSHLIYEWKNKNKKIYVR